MSQDTPENKDTKASNYPPHDDKVTKYGTIGYTVRALGKRAKALDTNSEPEQSEQDSSSRE